VPLAGWKRAPPSTRHTFNPVLSLQNVDTDIVGGGLADGSMTEKQLFLPALLFPS
jgi:hypothetical protein